MLRFIAAIALLLPSASSSPLPSTQPGLGREWLTMLPGAWRVEDVLPDGRSRPGGSYVFAALFADTNVLEVTVRSSEGSVVTKGAVGSSAPAGRTLFYMAVGSNAQPLAITGRADDATRSIAWTLDPPTATTHPYNQGLVVSRVRVLAPGAFDWSSPGHWERRFRKIP